MERERGKIERNKDGEIRLSKGERDGKEAGAGRTREVGP